MNVSEGGMKEKLVGNMKRANELLVRFFDDKIDQKKTLRRSSKSFFGLLAMVQIP